MSGTTILLVAALFGSNSPRIDGPKAKQPHLAKEAKKHVGDITGYYSCEGEDSNGKRYKGVAMIVKKNDIYVVSWTVGIGSNFVGIGIRKGENLAISWALTSKKGVIRGVNLYKIEPGPRLTGSWATLPGDGFLQHETLTFLKRMDD